MTITALPKPPAIQYQGLPAFQWDDGGRRDAGFKGSAGDCGVRAIAIATGIAYRQVYDDLFAICKIWPGNTKEAKRIRANATPRKGLPRAVLARYLEELGWQRYKGINSQYGNLRINDPDLPRQRTLCEVRKHYVTLRDNTARDTWDSRMTMPVYTPEGLVPSKPRVVYWYWTRA